MEQSDKSSANSRNSPFGVEQIHISEDTDHYAFRELFDDARDSNADQEPVPLSTTATVRARIRKSSNRFQFSTYAVSREI